MVLSKAIIFFRTLFKGCPELCILQKKFTNCDEKNPGTNRFF